MYSAWPQTTIPILSTSQIVHGNFPCWAESHTVSSQQQCKAPSRVGYVNFQWKGSVLLQSCICSHSYWYLNIFGWSRAIHIYCSCTQVYVIEVKWSEGTQTTVYRRYSAFFEFQVSKLYMHDEKGIAIIMSVMQYVVWITWEISSWSWCQESCWSLYTILTRCSVPTIFTSL